MPSTPLFSMVLPSMTVVGPPEAAPRITPSTLLFDRVEPFSDPSVVPQNTPPHLLFVDVLLLIATSLASSSAKPACPLSVKVLSFTVPLTVPYMPRPLPM